MYLFTEISAYFFVEGIFQALWRGIMFGSPHCQITVLQGTEHVLKIFPIDKLQQNYLGA
jgi:hypothetical protein